MAGSKQVSKAVRLAARRARTRLETWMTASEFRKQLAAITAEFGRVQTITVSYLGWYRDAWSALAFAEKTATRYLRVSPQVGRGPDFELRLRSGRMLPFQCTEAGATVEGKRKGLYEQWKLNGWTPRPDPFEDWIKRRRSIPGELQAAVNKKVGVDYPPHMNLLIYLNLGTYDTWVDEIEPELVKCTQDAAGKFSSVWVLWGGRLYRCSANPTIGLPGSFRPLPPVRLGTWRSRLEAKRTFAALFSD